MKTEQEIKREFYTLFLTIRNGIDTTGDGERVYERAQKWWRNQKRPPIYTSYAEFEADGPPETDPTDTRYGLWRPTGQALAEAKASAVREVKNYVVKYNVPLEVAYTEIMRSHPGIFGCYEEFTDALNLNEFRRTLQKQFKNAVDTLKSARGYDDRRAFDIVASSRTNVFTDYEQYKRLQQ